METFHAHDPALPEDPNCIALGFFDGVHRGHRKVLDTSIELARRMGLCAAVFTFRNHPREVLRPGADVRLLTTFEERTDLLARAGIQRLIWCDFTDEVAHLGPEQFVEEWLCRRLHAAAVVTGPNYTFGHQARGTPDLLVELGRHLGFEVVSVQPLTVDGQVVSSTRIRTLLQEGHVDAAADLLSYRYFVTSQVERGDARGVELGAPTANLPLPAQKVVPARGVYAVWVERQGSMLPGVANLGVAPTFGERSLLLEVHLLGRSESLYGELLKVHFVQKLRDEKKFDNVDDLKAQILADVRQADGILQRV